MRQKIFDFFWCIVFRLFTDQIKEIYAEGYADGHAEGYDVGYECGIEASREWKRLKRTGEW